MSRSGFTLVEILLAIAMFLIIGSMSSPLYSRFLLQNNTQNIVDQIAGEIRKAQIYAMEGRENSSWGVIYAGGNIVLFKGATYAGRDSAFDETFLVNPAVTITGLNEIVFTKSTGTPSATLSISVSGVGSSRSITTNAQGVVNK